MMKIDKQKEDVRKEILKEKKARERAEKAARRREERQREEMEYMAKMRERFPGQLDNMMPAGMYDEDDDDDGEDGFGGMGMGGMQGASHTSHRHFELPVQLSAYVTSLMRPTTFIRQFRLRKRREGDAWYAVFIVSFHD